MCNEAWQGLKINLAVNWLKIPKWKGSVEFRSLFLLCYLVNKTLWELNWLYDIWHRYGWFDDNIYAGQNKPRVQKTHITNFSVMNQNNVPIIPAEKWYVRKHSPKIIHQNYVCYNFWRILSQHNTIIIFIAVRISSHEKGNSLRPRIGKLLSVYK